MYTKSYTKTSLKKRYIKKDSEYARSLFQPMRNAR
jgi:hypothetical protein